MAGKRKISKGAYAGLILIYICMLIVILITLYPFIYVFSMSVSAPMSVLKQEVWFLPKGFNLDSYKMVFENEELWMHYGNTIWYTVTGTLVNMILTILGAYPLSRKSLIMQEANHVFYKFYHVFQRWYDTIIHCGQ